jgi:Sec-independent protein translocase protein TatA
VFDGLFGPWHLVILAVVIFLVLGPSRIADRWRDGADSLRRWTDPDAAERGQVAADAPVAQRRRTVWYRVGRRLRRRRD